MGDLSPVIEGHVKHRDGKKVTFYSLKLVSAPVCALQHSSAACSCVLPNICVATLCQSKYLLLKFYFSGSLATPGSSACPLLQVTKGFAHIYSFTELKHMFGLQNS